MNTAFKKHRLSRVGTGTAQSDVSRCRRVEEALNLNLDTCDLSDVGVANIATALKQQMPGSGMTENSLADCLSAVRRYREFRR